MEIEMKALCREDQIPNLFKNKLGNFTKINTESDGLLFKSDKYYSWGGEQLSKPKKIFRVRTEAEIAKFVKTADVSEKVLQTIKFFDSEDAILTDQSTYKAYLTYKKHYVLPDGSQSNIENEGEISLEAAKTLDIMMKSAGFDVYFIKNKKSCSLYFTSDKNGQILHCEIVKVNNLPVYLEIESIVKDEAVTDAIRQETIDTIKEFYQELGITSFEPRNWKQLIEA